ncbi:unnamed protein product, partial [marine sediment metagenome]
QAPPTKPTLTSPSDGFRTNDSTPTLEWTPATNADNHRVLVDDDVGFGSPAENDLLGSEDDNYTTGALADGTYYWEIVAINAIGENESDTRSFIVDTTPPTISGVSASNITQTSATITWTTDENSDSLVEYGTTTGYGSTE